MKPRWWITAAVIVPLVGLMALVARAELARRSGPSWQVAIAGYDPRDLLHGHFLRYQFRFNWQGESSCGSRGSLAADCCLCLSRSDGAQVDPWVRQVPCAEARRCDGWLRSESVRPPLRYFVPEDRALELESALRDRKASLVVTSGSGGKPAIGELLLDGRPWREVLADSP